MTPIPTYLDSIVIEYYNGAAWVDISAYVVGDIRGNNGLGGWKPFDRVANLGTLDITLNNAAKLFSPMGNDTARGLNTLAGFNTGAKIRVRGVLDSISYTIWIGRISRIDSDDKNWGNQQTRVTANDWMDVPAKFPMKNATIWLNKTIDQALALAISRLINQPEATSFDAGTYVFPAVFDNVKNKTMAAAEFTKLANSELGYIYVEQDGTLRAENGLARVGQRALDLITYTPSTISYLLKEDGFFLLKEDGGKIILDESVTEAPALAADAEGYDILLDPDSLLNSSTIRAYPVVTDTSLKVLYKLGTPLFIASGRTSEFSAHYADPNGLAQVNGTNMQGPVATTDYLANTAANGGGTDKTADVVVTATYYGDTVDYSIANNASIGIYMTLLQARGYGIYYGSGIESLINDLISQTAYGYSPFSFDQKYQKDAYLADMYGRAVVEEYKYPKSRIAKMRYLANLNKNHMMSFLILTIGALILGTEDRSGISNHYYITDRAFTIKQGGIINVEYGVKQNDSYLSGGLSPVTVEFAGYDLKNGLNYGYLHNLSNISQKSVSAWVYAYDPAGEPGAYVVMALTGGVNAGWYLAFRQTALILEFVQTDGTVVGGKWDTPANLYRNGWVHIVATRDSSSYATSPVMYINGVSQAITVVNAQTAASPDESSLNFLLGNLKYVGNDWTNPFKGKIFDARVYNRILTPAEVTTLYNGGTPLSSLVTSGLVFQGPAIYTDRPMAAGHVLGDDDRLVDNVLRAVGTPHNSPIIRANP